jgi:hypothetical protein
MQRCYLGFTSLRQNNHALYPVISSQNVPWHEITTISGGILEIGRYKGVVEILAVESDVYRVIDNRRMGVVALLPLFFFVVA